VAAIQRQRFDDGTFAGKPGLPDQRVICAARPLAEVLKRHCAVVRRDHGAGGGSQDRLTERKEPLGRFRDLESAGRDCFGPATDQ
jgi:hypothetical protein